MTFPDSTRSVRIMANDAAVQLLYDNIHALPHEEYGVINFLPFAHDSEQTRTVKRHLCEAIVKLLDAGGHLNHDAPSVEPLVSHDAVVQCNQCNHELITLPTNENGVGRVNATMFISSISRLNAQCPHGETTLDDMRRHMEQEFALAEAEDEPQEGRS